MQDVSNSDDAEVVVWRVDLHVPDETYEFCRRNIDAEEHARADRLIYEQDRRQFVISHAALRIVLASTLGVRPLDIRFRKGPRGRPLLAAPDALLQFSLSHSDAGCLIGAARDRRIGVDIEKQDPGVDCQSIADRFFAEHEAGMLKDADEEARRRLFFRLWTRKEAYLKATGLGLHGSLAALRCAAGDDGSLRIVAVDGSETGNRDWTLLDLDDGEFAACAIVEGTTQQYDIRTFDWERIDP